MVEIAGDPKYSRILENLDSPNWKVRRGAITSLALIEDPMVMRFLEVAMNDRNEHVRQAAVGVLGDLGTPKAIDMLINRGLSDESGFVRKDAAKALADTGSPWAVDALLYCIDPNKENYEKERLYFVRKAIAEALGKLGDGRATGYLKELLKDKEWEVRKAAVVALKKIGDQSVIDTLVDLFEKEESRYVRISLAEALIKLFGNSEKYPEVNKYVGNEVLEASFNKKLNIVRKAISIYLSELGTMRLKADKITKEIKKPSRLREDKETLPPGPGVKPVNPKSHQR